jgi:hypothetical protein
MTPVPTRPGSSRWPELHPAGANWTLGDLFLAILEENHDLEHLEQLCEGSKATLEG